MGEEVWFLASDGRRISCNKGSAAFDLMSRDGAFALVEVDGVPQPVSFKEPEAGEDLTKLSKKQLFELAATRDAAVDAKMNKADLIAAIEAAAK